MASLVQPLFREHCKVQLTVLQDFMQGAKEMDATEVIPDTIDILRYLEGYSALIPSRPVAYYVNERFLPTVPDELVASLHSLFSNPTLPQSTILIGSPATAAIHNNSATAFGFRNAWDVYVWPFWLCSSSGAAVDGMAIHAYILIILICCCQAHAANDCDTSLSGTSF